MALIFSSERDLDTFKMQGYTFLLFEENGSAPYVFRSRSRGDFELISSHSQLKDSSLDDNVSWVRKLIQFHGVAHPVKHHFATNVFLSFH